MGEEEKLEADKLIKEKESEKNKYSHLKMYKGVQH